MTAPVVKMFSQTDRKYEAAVERMFDAGDDQGAGFLIGFGKQHAAEGNRTENAVRLKPHTIRSIRQQLELDDDWDPQKQETKLGC